MTVSLHDNEGLDMLSNRIDSFSFCFISSLLALWIPSNSLIAQTRQQKVLSDKLKFEANGAWHYNDLDAGFETALRLNQPVLVVLRCIPCEECVKLDDDLIEENPKLRKLLKSFVRVRVVGANGLDLAKFQFDTDQSFAAFVFNADGTLYGRFGTRSDQTRWEEDVSVEGLGKMLEAALELHRDYPSNKSILKGKQADKPLFPSPEKIPSLASRFTSKLDYEGDTVKSCIHCHMIGEGLRANIRAEKGTIPETDLFSYPHPKTVGLVLDPTHCATIKGIVSGSDAEKNGFQIGDRIQLLAGQAILSIADVQWVLHHVPVEGGSVEAVIQRGDQTVLKMLTVPANWRSKEDIAWRASSWSLRQMGLGGMAVKPLTDDERRELSIGDGQMALSVQHVGAHAPHDRAKKAGVQKGDIVIEYDGRTDLLRETDLLAYSMNKIAAGQSVQMRIRRGVEQKTVEIATAK